MPDPEAPQRRLRLWPAAVIVALQAATILLSQASSITNFPRFVSMMAGPGVCVLLAAVWVVFFSRLRWFDGASIVAVAAALGSAAWWTVYPMMKVVVWIYGAPLAIALSVFGVALARNWSSGGRLALVSALLAAGWAAHLLGRVDGFDGDYRPQLAWRWLPSPEEELVAAQPTHRAAVVESAGWTPGKAEWPGFRGALRNGIADGSIDSLDWNASPPREVWRINVGPGWGSFAHVSGRLFSQEQRGDEDAVVCYDAADGKELWRHGTPSRFVEVVSGAGPRGTPTYADGRVFALGGRGVFVALDAATGEVLWKHDYVADWDAPVPMWGFAASPLVVGDLVIVYADGSDGRALVAHDVATGELRWKAASGGMNYASAQPADFDGAPTVLFADSEALRGLDPATGAELWTFDFPEGTQAPMVQPQQIGAESVVVALGDGIGVARVDVTREEGAWTVKKVWDSRDLKPSFNDFVHHAGHIYGFDQNMLACIDFATGKRQWKRGRYGFGQLVLLPDAERLVVVSEKGDLVAVGADPAKHAEHGTFAAIEGKTWNHPIVVGDRLFVRNGEEAACVELAAPAATVATIKP
ncbi:MAG: PQQ-binding-like beta-propeller repeat protein [Lacipirellulaceae bacterium]